MEQAKRLLQKGLPKGSESSGLSAARLLPSSKNTVTALFRLFHMDVYRMEEETETGLDEYFKEVWRLPCGMGAFD